MRLLIAPHHFRGRRGFATIMAISLIILVGAALVLVSAGIVAEAKKTRADAVDAQLRQLLIAGAAAATRSDVVTAAESKAIPVSLPAQIVEEGAAVTLTAKKEGEKVSVRVIAEFARRRASQTLTFAREGEGWKLADARLD